MTQLLVPMAGAGSRFVKAGYGIHKPCLPVASTRGNFTVPMVVQAIDDLPISLNKADDKLLFVVRDFHINDGIDELLLKHFPKSVFTILDRLTDGQALSCQAAFNFINMDMPLMIAACDNGITLNKAAFERLIDKADAAIFTFSGNEAILKNPSAYGWVDVENNMVKRVSVKKPISENPIKDNAIVGCFWFKRASLYFDAAAKMFKANDKINNEFYVDQIFNHFDPNLNVVIVPVEEYICWGTPEEYERCKDYYAEK